MDKATDIFFAVLRAGLWEQDLRLDAAPSAAEWQQVLQTARAQAVLGLVYRGMAHLPAEQLPPGAERLRLLADVDRLERGGRMLAAAQAELLERFAAAGLHSTVQKGTEAAKYYAKPSLREAGDIDLYFPAGEFGRAAVLVAEYNPWTASDGSLVYKYKGVTVEHHGRYFDLHVRAERLPEVPSVVAELVMLSAHILKHAIGEGVGCKQLCDVARALDRAEGRYDKAALAGVLHACGLQRWHRLLCSLLVSDLGLDLAHCLPDFRPCDPAPLRRIVLRGGAFGYADPARLQAARRGLAARKIHAGSAFLRRLPFSLRIAPREAVSTLAELIRGNLT
ncbi:MAG: nucleotidyltransferase family protein [Bacteroidales bacterium]|nr:nucleotidyltransferase family protein [Bacteroidales bacterium]